MQIAEMRSALETDYTKSAKFGDQFPTMPDWAVRRIFEKRNGLTLTPLPSGMEVRSASSILATARRNGVVVKPVIVADDDPDDEKKKLGFMLEALRLL